MSLQLQPVRIGAGSIDPESHLAFADGFLVAVLARLSDEHGDQVGMWFLKAGFGRLDHTNPPIFANLDAAQAWIADLLLSVA